MLVAAFADSGWLTLWKERGPTISARPICRGIVLDRLTLLATHALSSAIFGFVLIEHGGVDVAVGALSGAVVFLCLEFNVGYGQGFLFGEPRPLRGIGEIYDRRAMDVSAATASRAAPVLARRLAS